MQNPKILIVGAFGFLGQHATKYFSDEGYDIYVAVKSTTKLPIQLEKLNFEVVYTDQDYFFKKIQQIDFVAILYAAVLYGKSNDEKVRHCNVEFPIKIINRLREVKPLFLYFDTFFNKYTNYNYLNTYTSSKRDFRKQIEKFPNQKIVILQLEHLYGRNDNPSKFIPMLLNKIAKKDQEIELTKGDQKRDFLYIDDLLVLLLMLVKQQHKLEVGSHFFEIGTGVSVSVYDFIREIKNQLDSTSNLNFGALPYRENEIMDSKADLTKIQSLFQWTPEVDFKVGIKKLLSLS